MSLVWIYSLFHTHLNIPSRSLIVPSIWFTFANPLYLLLFSFLLTLSPTFNVLSKQDEFIKWARKAIICLCISTIFHLSKNCLLNISRIYSKKRQVSTLKGVRHWTGNGRGEVWYDHIMLHFRVEKYGNQLSDHWLINSLPSSINVHENRDNTQKRPHLHTNTSKWKNTGQSVHKSCYTFWLCEVTHTRERAYT